MPGKTGRREFGYVRRLPSGRWQASYIGPDGERHSGLVTFAGVEERETGIESSPGAEKWLNAERRRIDAGTWDPPAAPRKAVAGPVTFADYADAWLAQRNLKPRTRSLYRKLLAAHILPTFAAMPVKSIKRETIRVWYAKMGFGTPTARAHAYSLLRTILSTAVDDEILPANPCHIRGAGATARRHDPRPATLEELATITDAMPAKYRLMVSLASWCALRFGELAELRRSDLDLTAGVIKIRRGVVRADGQVIVGTPKSDAGVRDVSIPAFLIPAIRDHVKHHAGFGRDGLLFPAVHGGQLNQSTVAKVFYPARAKAGRPDLRFHDLRHTGAVMAAEAGATLPELMERLGHSTVDAALRYQHVSKGSGARIAAALNARALGAS